MSLALCACGGSNASSAPDAGPVGPHPEWSADPHAPGNPFPDDRLVDGGALTFRDHFWEDYVAKIDLGKTLTTFEQGNAPSLATVSGHGNSGFTLVKLSDPLDPSSISGHVFFAQKLAGTWTHGPEAVTQFVDPGDGKYFLAVRPAVPFANGQPAALVLTQGLRTTSGALLVAPPDFAAAAKKLDELPEITGALGVRQDQVLLELDLAVQDATADLVHIAQWASHDAPVSYQLHLPDGGNDPLLPLGVWTGPAVSTWADNLRNPDARNLTPDAGYEDVGTVALGTFESHDLRDIQYDANGQLVSAAFKPEWVQNPDLAPTVPLHFVLTLPKQRQANGKYRVIIVGHGLQSRNTFDTSASRTTQTLVGAMAELMAQQGIGCIGIDALDHGTRGDITQFFNLKDLRSSRENFRQTEVDLLQLSRLVGQLDIDGDGVPDLDATDVGYFGNSLGSIMGAPFLAVDSRVKYGVLNVPTGGLAMMFLSDQQAPYLHEFVGLLVAVDTGWSFGTQPQFDDALLVLSAEGQAVLEPADPFNFGYLYANKHVLAQEGVGDQTLPNVNTDELFAAMGLSAVQQTRSDPSGVSGFSKVLPADYGVTDPDFNPHGVFFRIPQVAHQAVSYLASHGTQLEPLHP